MYLKTSLASQWDHWNRPYYRFPIVQHQQSILAHLEHALSTRAVLRYACAAFWTYRELQLHQTTNNVLAQSTFVSATVLAGHEVWTYDSPGVAGYANPNGENIPTDTIASLWSKAKEKSKGRMENLFQHLRGLCAEIELPTMGNVDLPWLMQLSNQFQLDTTRRQALADTVELAGRFGRAGATWFVVDLEIPNP
jgi:hypothetical protein